MQFLARSCSNFGKDYIYLQDISRNVLITRILQDPWKVSIFSRPGLLHLFLQSRMMEVTQFFDDKWEDLLNVPKEIFFKGYGIRLDGVFEMVMQAKLLLQLGLSASCILFNALFISFLLSKKHFRSWMFFPIFLQALVDIISAGFMNIWFENLYMNHLQNLKKGQLLEIGEARATIYQMTSLYATKDFVYCFLSFSRILLNE